MWNVIGVNRLLDKRNRQKQYIKHRRTLSCIKSQVDNVPPQQYSFLNSKPKTKMQAYQKQMSMQAQNQDLVRRMIQPVTSKDKSKRKSSRNSLHSTYFKYVADKIQKDNAKLVERLQGATACVNFNNLQEQHRKKLQWRQSHKKASNYSQRPFSGRPCSAL